MPICCQAGMWTCVASVPSHVFGTVFLLCVTYGAVTKLRDGGKGRHNQLEDEVCKQQPMGRLQYVSNNQLEDEVCKQQPMRRLQYVNNNQSGDHVFNTNSRGYVCDWN